MRKSDRTLLPAVILILMVTGALMLMVVTSLMDPAGTVGLTLTHYRRLLENPAFWPNTLYSLYLAVAASLLATVAGTLTAYSIATSENAAVRRLSERVMQAGLVLPYLYAVFLAFLLLGQAGLLSRLALALGVIDSQVSFPVLIFDPAALGMIWVYAFKGIPFVTLMTLTIMTRINRQYQGVARTLGAGGLQQLLRIYLPLSRRVILWSSLVLFAYALGSFEVPHFMSAFTPRPLAASLYSLYLRPGLSSYYEAMAQGILMLVFGTAAAGVYLGALNRLLKSTLNVRGNRFRAGPRFAPVWLTVLSALWLIPMGYVVLYSFFAAIPFPELLPSQFSLQFWENTLLRNTLFGPALYTSVQLAVFTGLITTALGMMAARSLSRMKRHTSLSWFALISLPLFVPAMILMLSLHLLMLRFSLANSKTAVLLAHVIISLPYATAILTAYFKGIGTGLEETAKTLGCTPFHYYRKLLLPLMMPGLFFSFCIGFLLSFSELFSVLLLGGGNVLTFSMLMYPAMTNSQWGTGAVMGTLFLLIHLGLFLLADRWVRRSLSGTDYLF